MFTPTDGLRIGGFVSRECTQMMKTAMIVLAAASVASVASAGIVTKAADSSKTASLMHGGNRELTSLGFSGVSNLMGGSNFTQWTDGRLINNIGTYGWNTPVPRDMNTSGNSVSGNPDRADSASLLTGEGSGTGRLSDVFGSPLGYKNMSWIIDGEDSGGYTIDLYYGPGKWINSDNDNNTMEISVLERGGNSDFNVYGIKADGSYTSAIFVSRSQTARVGWTLDTLEIGGAQQVHGVGISFDDSWDHLIGVRIEAKSNFNGPDIVAVGSTCAVPTPGSLGVLAAGATLGLRRRRK